MIVQRLEEEGRDFLDAFVGQESVVVDWNERHPEALIRFGEPILFEGDPNEPDSAVEQKAQLVKDRISLLIEEGLAERQGWFA